jgi:hypothetical protein
MERKNSKKSRDKQQREEEEFEKYIKDLIDKKNVGETHGKIICVVLYYEDGTRMVRFWYGKID